MIHLCYFQMIMMIILYLLICCLTNKFTVEYEQKLPFLDILVRCTGSYFEYSFYRKPTNINALFHFFSFHDVKIIKISFLGIMLANLRVCSPINSAMKFTFCTPFSATLPLGYPKHLVDQVFSASKKIIIISLSSSRY